MDKKTKGFWAIAARKHLKEFVDYSENGDIFDCLNVSGKTGLFLGAIRGNKQLDNVEKIEKMASQVGIKPIELHKVILPQLEQSSDKKIEIKRDITGSINGIEEYVFDTQSTLEITGKVFEDLRPTEKEIIVVKTLEETKKVPYTQNEIVDMMVQEGFKEEDTLVTLDVDVFVMGDDWEGKFDFLKEYCEVVYLPRTEGISSTMIKSELKQK